MQQYDMCVCAMHIQGGQTIHLKGTSNLWRPQCSIHFLSHTVSLWASHPAVA